MRKPAPLIDYDKVCRQTVTVYHRDGNTYTRTVHRNAFLDFRKTQTTDKTGSREANAFLLVIPGAVQAVFVGDKVLLGEGPQITTADEWRKFVPADVPGLVEVEYADPKFWENGGVIQVMHTEAGG